MMNTSNKHRANAIVLRRSPYMERDLIVTFFTQVHGKMKGIAKGAKKSVKRFSGGFDPGILTTISWKEKQGSDLLILEESDLFFSPHYIQFDQLAALGVALDLVDHISQPHQESELKYQLLSEFIQSMSHYSNASQILSPFIFTYLSFAGFQPELTECVECKTTKSAEWVFHGDKGGVLCRGCSPSRLGGLVFSDDERRGLSEFSKWPPREDLNGKSIFPLAAEVLKRYIHHVLEKPLKSMRFLEQMGEKTDAPWPL